MAQILIVDDNTMGLLARRSVLEELGHHVAIVSTPEDALSLYQKHKPDIVITDYKMPRINGIELITRLRRQDPGISVILISGFVDTLGLGEQNTGADVVVQKSSHEVSHLIRSVNRLLLQKKTGTPKGVKTVIPQRSKRRAR